MKNIVRLGLVDLEKQYDKTEDDMKALQSVGQIIGEVLKQLDDERCGFRNDYKFIYRVAP
jgi:26S proteasome regulatory subunit T4